jgi:hypothetical protein
LKLVARLQVLKSLPMHFGSLNTLAPVPLNIRGVKRVRNPNKNPGNSLISERERDF